MYVGEAGKSLMGFLALRLSLSDDANQDLPGH